ncbi:MAG: hypothetical protein WAT23_20060 [Chromatiaceae bacterium]
MKVQIVVTRDCDHRQNLARAQADLEIGDEPMFVEDQPGLAKGIDMRHSTTRVVEDRVVFRGQPGAVAFSTFFSGSR